MTENYILDGGEPLARALERARSAAVEEADAAYGEVLDLVAADDAGLWAVLAAEHISVLRAAGSLTAAASRCEAYLREDRILTPRSRLPLLLERALVRSESGAHADAASDAAEIRKIPDAELDLADHARLRRVEGLAAGDRATADRCLHEARSAFESVGDTAAAAAVDADLRLLQARDGSEKATSAILAADPAEMRSAPRALARALALRNQHRYEEALQAVVAALAAADLDDALRLPVLEEMIGLLVALRRGKALRAVSDELAKVLVRAGGSVEGTEPPAVRFARTLLKTFHLLERGEVEQARAELETIRTSAVSDRDRAYWHLASGEASIEAFKRGKAEAKLVEAAVQDLTAATEYAAPDGLLDVRIRALRLLGEAFERLKRPGQASECWARAHALEEDLVARQISDEVRATLLEDVPDEHDERLRVAAELAVSGPGGAPAATAVAAAIAAMESARGAAILGRIAPDAEGSLRRLPAPGDGAAAWQWLRGIADATTRDEAIWIMHARPGRVHHGVVGRDFAHHIDLPADRGKLKKLVKALRKECNEFGLGRPEGRANVSRLIEQLGAEIGVETVLDSVPRRIKRLVVIAGGVLSDIPIAALPVKDGPDGAPVPIVCRFALSDLPCLSARPLLRQRSVGNRGSRTLMISAFEATPEDFERELLRRKYRRVRILGHGQTDPKDPSQTWLQFAGTKPERDGRMRPGRFQQAHLQACGTLILGACESGMAQRVGRDERTGFVRAGLHAGAASVVAARWIAEVSITAALLDRFEDYLRYLPRDVALQRAQLDVRDGRVELGSDVPEPGHPAWWACWTLYGDSGHQVKAPILRASARGPALLIRRLFRTS